MKRITAVLLVLILFLLPLCAHAQEAVWSVSITDHAGRTVVLQEAPETIISGYYIATSMLIGLGQADKLIGVENDAQKRPVYGLSAPELLDLPGMGTVKLFDLEMCALLDPDLVILPLRLADLAENLEALGFTVLFVNPETQILLEETLEMLGKATGSQARSAEMTAFIHDALSHLEEKLDGTGKPRVYLAGNSAFLKTAGPLMYQHSLIENAGGENVAQEIGDSYWAEISYEQLLAWDPEYIILAADAKYSIESVLEDPVLAGCTAIQNGNVYQIPNALESWDSPVPGSVLGSLYLASVLHPDAYGADEYADAAQAFYETFYGFQPEI